MELVLSNNQGELDPLEIGIHAFQAVPIAKGGRGKKGGLSEYAERIGKDRKNCERYRDAGEVVKNVGINTHVFLGRAQHLAAIHKLSRENWQPACEWLASSAESVKDVQARVDLAKGESEPRRQLALFLKQTTARELERIEEIYLKVLAELAVVPALTDEWTDWFQAEIRTANGGSVPQNSAEPIFARSPWELRTPASGRPWKPSGVYFTRHRSKWAPEAES